jgi:hypothetical protein
MKSNPIGWIDLGKLMPATEMAQDRMAKENVALAKDGERSQGDG